MSGSIGSQLGRVVRTVRAALDEAAKAAKNEKKLDQKLRGLNAKLKRLEQDLEKYRKKRGKPMDKLDESVKPKLAKLLATNDILVRKAAKLTIKLKEDRDWGW
jgi:signal recognition particle GTPase